MGDRSTAILERYELDWQTAPGRDCHAIVVRVFSIYYACIEIRDQMRTTKRWAWELFKTAAAACAKEKEMSCCMAHSDVYCPWLPLRPAHHQENHAMAQLALARLGPLQATLDGVQIAGFESQKVRALLVYLALEADCPHGRDALAGLLWPDQPDQAARTNLPQALTNLRLAIGE